MHKAYQLAITITTKVIIAHTNVDVCEFMILC